MKKRSVTQMFLVALLALFTAGNLFAQGTGTLRGQVLDPSGAVVAGAIVTAKNANGQTATATSNSQGVYEIKGLAPGAYTLTVTAKGFSTFTTDNVQVA